MMYVLVEIMVHLRITLEVIVCLSQRRNTFCFEKTVLFLFPSSILLFCKSSRLLTKVYIDTPFFPWRCNLAEIVNLFDECLLICLWLAVHQNFSKDYCQKITSELFHLFCWLHFQCFFSETPTPIGSEKTAKL